MALTTEDLEQIRVVVRKELGKPEGIPWKLVLGELAAFFGMFFAVIGLHILVIAGFTIYHLMPR